MNDQSSNEQPTGQDVQAASPKAGDAAFLRRRRLLKLGTAAVPVSLTLVSRPVRAWHCNTTSAWGSAQLTTAASVQTRLVSKQLPDESWTIANWCDNSTRAGLRAPWVALGSQTETSAKVKDSSKGYTVGNLCGASGPFPKGLSKNDSVWEKVKNGTTFQKYMLVAQLNAKLIPNVNTCLNPNSSTQLADMFDGRFKPSNRATNWTEAEIIDYLEKNYIVRAS